MKILLIIPPFTQINTTYPSITQLSGFLNSKGYNSESLDLSIKVFLRIFSEKGLKEIFNSVKNFNDENSERLYILKNQYISKVNSVISFLQGQNPNLAYTLAVDGYLPQGESFFQEVDEEKSFGELGIQDKAKYYCSLFIDDLTRFIQKNFDPNFGLSRYAEKIAVSLANFDPLLNELNKPFSLIEKFMQEEILKVLSNFDAEIICLSVPFPGNLLGALQTAKFIKSQYPEKTIITGGGYVNTELRKIKDYRIFDYIDFLTFDDGELPILNIIKNFTENPEEKKWVRTISPQNEIFCNIDSPENINHNEMVAPSLKGINPDEYISMSEMLNPMHRLWSDGYWNKLTTAHGCYWHRCSFCDTSLDYIKRYSPAKAVTIVDWMEDLIKQSGKNSFHFTDEAAPPTLLRDIAIEILNRKLKISWWGNIRYEKTFTADLCKLLALSGCIAVSGGIEVANDRILKLINKGVSINQAVNVCANFTEAGIMTHAYLMFGFPTQTEPEIVDSLEIVRQFTESGLITSAFWHQFSLTYHSPVYYEKEKFEIKLINSPENNFANNDLQHKDKTGLNYSKYSFGLNKALYNFMHGNCFDWHSNQWFDFKMPKTSVKRNLVEKILSERENKSQKKHFKIFWFGSEPILTKNKKTTFVTIHSNNASAQWEVNYKTANWLKKYLSEPGEIKSENFKNDCPENYDKFINSEIFNDLKELGLITF